MNVLTITADTHTAKAAAPRRSLPRRLLRCRSLLRRVTLIAAVCVAIGGRCHAQEKLYDVVKEWARVSVDGGAGVMAHTVEMTGLPGVPSCCPEYTQGTGSGLQFGVSGELVLWQGFSVGLRAGFATYSGTLTATEEELVTSERDTTTATFGHTIRTQQPAVTAELYFSYEAFPRLGVQLGMRSDLMLGGTFSQTEEILAPGTIRFENGSRRRMVDDGDIIDESSLYPAITVGVRYDVPLNRRRTLMLTPRLHAWQGLGSLVDGVTLRMRGVQLGIGIAFIGLGRPGGPSPLEPVQH